MIRAVDCLSDVIQSGAKPRLWGCSDGHKYIVKTLGPKTDGYTALGQAKGMIADQIIGRLGNLMDAPIPQTRLVALPEGGLAHGSRFIKATPIRLKLRLGKMPTIPGGAVNRRRFAFMAVCDAWTAAQYPPRHQLLFAKDPPHCVFSFDHGDFFRSEVGQRWSASCVDGGSSCKPENFFLSQVFSFTPGELMEPVDNLAAVKGEAISDVVGIVPREWGITPEERRILIQTFTRRRDEVVRNVRTRGTVA